MLNAVTITCCVINALEAAVIIIGNAFTIFVFWTQRRHLKRTCFLLINLAVADLLVGITEPIVIATEKIPRSEAPPGKERLITNHSSVFQRLGSSTSVYFLALTSIERACAVLWPLRHDVMSTRVYIYSIVVAWALGLWPSLLPFLPLQWNIKAVAVINHSCFFVSLLAMCASYVMIRTRLRSRAPRLDTHDRNSTERSLQLSKTFFVVVALSLVFWLPAFVVYVILLFCKRCFPPNVVRIVNTLHLANSMVNPFVYSFRMPTFRKALNKSWCKRNRIPIKPVQTCRHVLGRRGSFTLQMDNTISTPAQTLTCHRSKDDIELSQAVLTAFKTPVEEYDQSEPLGNEAPHQIAQP